MSLRLHEKYGVNATVSACFWCGKSKNEIALLGAAYKEEAPRNMVLDYDPCDVCRENMTKGITIIEAGPGPGREIQPGLVPTGRWCVVTDAAVGRIFTGSVQQQILDKRKAFIEPAAWEMLQFPRE